MKMSGGTPTKEFNGSTPKTSLRVTPTKSSPFGSVTLKVASVARDVASSLDVVCYYCLCGLSYWNCIQSTGSCQDPFHEKVHFLPSGYI